MSRTIAQKIIRYRWWLIVAIFALTGFFAYHLKDISIYQQLTDIAPERHPYVQLNQYMGKVFGGYALISITLEVTQGDIFAREVLAKLVRIQKKLERLRGVVPAGVHSIVSRALKHTTYTTDEYGYPTIQIENINYLVERVLRGDKETYKKYRQFLLNNERIYGSLISPDKKATLIQAQFFTDRDYWYLFTNIREIIQDEQDLNTRFYLSGRPIAMGYLYLYLKKMIALFALAIGLIMLLLLFAFGTIRGIVIPLWAGLVTVIWGLGSEAMLGFKIDIMSIMVPFMIMAIEVSHSVQILNRYYEEFDQWRDNKKAAEETISHLFIPGLSSIVTDGVGFATLLLVPFRLIRVMAGLATYGVLRILLTTIIFLPAFLSILPPPTEKEIGRVRARGQTLSWFLTVLARLSYQKRPLVWAVAALFLVLGIGGVLKLEVGELQPGEPIFWQDAEYNQAEKINNRFRGTNPYLIYIAGQKEYDLWDPEVVKEVFLLQRNLEDMEGVKGSRSYIDVLLRMNRAYHHDDPRWEVLPQERTLIAEFLNRFAHSGGPETSRPYFEIDQREASLVLFVKDHQGKTIRRLFRATNQYLANNHSSCLDIKLAAGIIGVYAAIMEEIKQGQFWNLFQISAAIFLFCLLTFRSLIISLIITFTLGLGTLITYAVMGYGKIGLFIYTLPIASLGMGLGVDYAIYVISRLGEELAAEEDYQQAWIKAMATSGKAILFTALSVAMGGFALLFSSIRFQAIMGGMLTVVVFANMLGALLLLPTLIAWVKVGVLSRPNLGVVKE